MPRCSASSPRFGLHDVIAPETTKQPGGSTSAGLIDPGPVAPWIPLLWLSCAMTAVGAAAWTAR